jgi:two-component system sensor histidine kinase RegB
MKRFPIPFGQPLAGAARMRQLACFRSLSLLLQVLAVWAGTRLLDGPWPVAAVGALLTGNLVLLAVLWWRSRDRHAGRDPEIFAHLLADQVVLFLLVALTGGAANPFVMLLLLPLALAAVLLPGRYVIVLLLTAVLGYLALLAGSGHGAGDAAYRMHLQGMWVAFAWAALLLAFFVHTTARVLREREAALRRMQMQRLRDEKLLALGAQAATAAHELGTPLSTARLLCEEVRATELTDEQRELLDDLEGQVRRSGELLRTLADHAHRRQGQRIQIDDLEAWLREQVEHWRALHPEIAPVIEVDIDLKPVTFEVDEGISDALNNLLTNAAEVSPKDVRLRAGVTEEGLALDVLDRGPGMSGEPEAGTDASDSGLGMGVLLATALIERAGGRLVYEPRAGGGTRARILLPRTPEASV